MKDFDVVFTSTKTCTMCKLAKNQLETAIKEFDPDINLKYISLDDNPKYGEFHNITSVPTVIFFKDDIIVNRITGIRTKSDYSEILFKAYGDDS